MHTQNKDFLYLFIMSEAKKVVLVTGGSGLVGQAIKHFVENGGAEEGEEWFYATSKDADLSSAAETKALFDRVKVFSCSSSSYSSSFFVD